MGTVASIELATLVELPGPRPIPGSTVPFDEFDGLRWSEAPGATAYQVYFGTSLQSVQNATPGSEWHLGTSTDNRFGFETPPAWGYRYFWRIDAMTPDGILPGTVRHFDIPFPAIGEPLTFAAPFAPAGIMLDQGASLLASNHASHSSSYAVDPMSGGLTFEQHIGGIFTGSITSYSEIAASGQGWMFRAEKNDSFNPKPTALAIWSRDAFSGHWRQRQPLMLSPPAALGSTATALASDGGHVLAGLSAPQSSGPGRVIAGIEWPQPRVIGSLQASDGVNGDTFGSSIAIDGTQALIGAHGFSSRPGRAYFFEFVPGTATWVQREKLQPTNTNGNHAGGAVALDGSTAVLAPGGWSVSTANRKIHIYRKTRTGWNLAQEIGNPSSTGNTRFGYAVALHGGMVFVSERDASRIHVYHLQNGLWIPGAPIMPPSGTNAFGHSLVARDGVLYVGSENEIHGYRLHTEPNRRPHFINPPPARMVTDRPADIEITASDPDGTEGLVITARSLPAGLTLVDHGQGRASLRGSPTSAAGSRVFAQWSVSDPGGTNSYQGGFIELIRAEDIPAFIRQPDSINVGEGQSVQLTASVGNDETISWQWLKSDQPIEGATMPYLIIEKATMDDAGNYRVSATNEAGTTHSAPAIISVRPPDLDGGPWSTRGNTATRSGHHPATLGRVTFQPAWTRKLADIGRLDLPVIAGDRVFTGISDWQSGPLLALNLHNGETLWSYPANPGSADSYNRGAPSWFDGRIYVQTHGNSPAGLHCLNDATGARLWTVPMSAQHDAFSFPAVTSGGIFHCAGYYGGMYAVEMDGIMRFYHTPPSSPGGLAAVHRNRVFTFSGGTLYEHQAAGGSVIWSLSPPDMNKSGARIPVIADDCALIVDSGELLCIDTRTRELRWRRSGPFDGTPSVHNGNAYAIHRDGVTAMSLADGMVTANYPTPVRPNNHGNGGQQPLLLNDHLLVSSTNATWVFRLADGELVQTIPAGGGILAYSNGHLLVTGSDGGLYAGNTLQAFRANSAPEFSVEIPTSTIANDAADPMTLVLGPYAGDVDPGDPLSWAIVSVSRPEVFRTLEIQPQSGDLTVIYNPWESGSSDVTVSVTDSAGNVTEHTITFTVPPHPEPELELTATLNLNRQTGLYEHAITVTNTGAREVAGFDLRITGLPDGVTVNNASGRDGGDWIIHHRQPLAAGDSVNLLIEYYTPVRGTVIDPQVSVELITVPETHPDAPEGGLAVERCVRMEDGTVMIEFASTPGALYEIHYSADAQTWKLSPVRVRAAGNRVQWIDSGPPRTETPPSGEPCRFYRVREIPEP
ncbi:MAG TPA: PQQ-binding-like beta-propeller repeat protein [Luteolibacter sp.]|nr:PQQ-binding-like beta-propeller repeat protein [Luteolibacter sp.]